VEFEFVQKRYEDELARKEKIRDGIAVPISALIVLGSLIATMARGFSYLSSALTIEFLAGVFVAMIFVAVCLYNFFNAFQSQPYREIGPLEGFRKTEADLVAYYSRLADFYRQTGDASAAEKAEQANIDEKFKSLAVAQMISFTDLNQLSNLAKMKYLERGTDFLWLLVLCTMAIACPYVIDQARTPARAQVVHVDNLPAVKDVGNAR
jgi:hypothetical protein